MHRLRRINSGFRLCRTVIAVLAFSAIGARAEEPRQQALPQQSAPSESPGLLDEIGKLFKSPADLLSSFSKPQTAPSPDIVQPPPPVTSAPIASPPAAPTTPLPAAEPPATASTRLFPGMVSGREICPRSANGAPDCQAGTDKLCQSKGYKGGKSLNMDSAFTCSPRQARADGRKPCGTEHFVTSAFCQ